VATSSVCPLQVAFTYKRWQKTGGLLYIYCDLA